jgi:CheY-like chemotaxis protein
VKNVDVYEIGPRAQRVLDAVRERIATGEWQAGTKLPAHTELAETYGVAPLTVRQVIARLEREGLVVREHGRGTFVRRAALPAALVVDDDPNVRNLLAEHVRAMGLRALPAANAAEAMAALIADPAVALVLSDVRLPDPSEGIELIRTIRRRWPELPVAAVTAYPQDLDGLHGTPECPVLVLAKPFRAQQLREAIRFAIASNTWISQSS